MSTSLFYRFVVVLLTIVAVSMSGTVFGQQTTNPGEEEQPDFAVVEELLKELGTNIEAGFPIANDPFVIAALLRSNLDRLNGATVAEFLVKLGGAPHDILMEDLGNAVENRPGSRPMEDILSDILNAQPDEHYPSTGAGGDMRPGGQYGPPPGTGQGNLAPFKGRGGKYGPPLQVVTGLRADSMVPLQVVTGLRVDSMVPLQVPDNLKKVSSFKNMLGMKQKHPTSMVPLQVPEKSLLMKTIMKIMKAVLQGQNLMVPSSIMPSSMNC
jgi:hypothetical protein